jgi:hypothetical protein
MAVEQQPPDVLAMVLADDIHRDTDTGKFFILGTYATITAPAFPWTQPALIVYLAFTDGRGQTPLSIRLVDVEEARPPVFESNALLNFSDPLAVIEMAFYQPEVIFPQLGEYRLQLFGAGQFLRERRLFVLFAPTNGRPT